MLNFLKTYGISTEVINSLYERLEEGHLYSLNQRKENSIEIITYLRNLGLSENSVNNIIAMYEFILFEPIKFLKEEFDRFDTKLLVEKINTDFSILEKVFYDTNYNNSDLKRMNKISFNYYEIVDVYCKVKSNLEFMDILLYFILIEAAYDKLDVTLLSDHIEEKFSEDLSFLFFENLFKKLQILKPNWEFSCAEDLGNIIVKYICSNSINLSREHADLLFNILLYLIDNYDLQRKFYEKSFNGFDYYDVKFFEVGLKSYVEAYDYAIEHNRSVVFEDVNFLIKRNFELRDICSALNIDIKITSLPVWDILSLYNDLYMHCSKARIFTERGGYAITLSVKLDGNESVFKIKQTLSTYLVSKNKTKKLYIEIIQKENIQRLGYFTLEEAHNKLLECELL